MAKRNEAERLFELTSFERGYWDEGLTVCGMDEVGRGPLAGPVVTCCIIIRIRRNPVLQMLHDRIAHKQLFGLVGCTVGVSQNMQPDDALFQRLLRRCRVIQRCRRARKQQKQQHPERSFHRCTS